MAVSEHFSDSELKCPCCGENEVRPDFLERLEQLRHMVGFALPISSGYRCSFHNGEVSTTSVNGPHTTGRAVDIIVSHENAYTLVITALSMGYTGIGIHQRGGTACRFIHLDDLKENRPRVWSY